MLTFPQRSSNSMLNSEIARRAKRAYVFTPLIWAFNVGEADYFEDTESHLVNSTKLRAARTPLRAYIDSPTSGAPWPAGDPTPRAVSVVWWERMCPQEKRVRVDGHKVNQELGVDIKKDQAAVIMEKWSCYLHKLEAQCVDISLGSPQFFDWECVRNADPQHYFEISSLSVALFLPG